MKQNLIIQIDTAHDDIKGHQTPEVVFILRNLADHFSKCGVQMTAYPIQEAYIRVDLLESGNDENWEPSLFVPHLDTDNQRNMEDLQAAAEARNMERLYAADQARVEWASRGTGEMGQ
jgi:hypothetical protein